MIDDSVNIFVEDNQSYKTAIPTKCMFLPGLRYKYLDIHLIAITLSLKNEKRKKANRYFVIRHTN